MNSDLPYHLSVAGKPTHGSPRCSYCGRTPAEIPGLSELAAEEGLSSADEYVRRNEGTYNYEVHRFACDECYVERGCPSLPASRGRGWKAP